MDLNRVNPCSAGLDKTKPCVISSLASLGWWEGNHSQRDRCPYLSLVLPSAPLPVFSMDENQPEAWGQGSPHNQPLKSRERRKMIPHNGGVKWRANNSEFQWYRYQVYFSSVAQTCPILCDPWTTARQAPLSITSSQRLLKLMSIELVMPSNHLILYHPLTTPLPPSVFLSIFSNESVLHIRWPKYWSFSFNINPSNE